MFSMTERWRSRTGWGESLFEMCNLLNKFYLRANDFSGRLRMKQLDKIRWLALSALMSAIPLWATGWKPDSLGGGYCYRYVDQGRDYSGPVRSTIVRKDSPRGSGFGVLYVHGFNDYFFQTEMGDFFVNNGINFYAVDLRKYGRSLMPGQKRFQVRDLKEYFPDIDSAMVAMRADGITDIILLGHSTGGLITSYYLSKRHPVDVKGLILNSPFLDWNLGWFTERVLVPAVSMVAALAPDLTIPQGGGTGYSESLLAGEHGRWNYDTSKKLKVSPDVDAGWVRAIDDAQGELQRGDCVNIPILLMHSDNSVSGSEWSEAFNHGDAVLDVEDISRYGRTLGPLVTEATVKGGLHDLVLSEPKVARAVYNTMLKFICRLGFRSTVCRE